MSSKETQPLQCPGGVLAMLLITTFQEGIGWGITLKAGFYQHISCVSRSLTQEVLQVLSVMISHFSKDGDLQNFLSL